MTQRPTAPAATAGDRQLAGAGGVQLLTVAAAGKQMGASESHVYRLVASGVLRVVDISQPGARKSKSRIRSDDLLEFLEARTRGSPPVERDGGGHQPPSKSRPRRSPITPTQTRAGATDVSSVP